MSSCLNSVFKGTNRILRILDFVPSMCDYLRQAPTTGVQTFRGESCCKTLVAEQILPSFLLSFGCNHQSYSNKTHGKYRVGDFLRYAAQGPDDRHPLILNPKEFVEDYNWAIIDVHLPLGKVVCGIATFAPNLSIIASLKNPGANGSFWISFKRSIMNWRDRLGTTVSLSQLMDLEGVVDFGVIA